MYLCLSIINCLPVFPSAPMADSWVCLSQVRYQHELELSRELQSKCRSSDETRKCKVSPNPPDRVTVIVSKGKVHFKVLPNQSEYYFGRKNTLTQHWAHRGQFTNTYWLSQCICRLNKILWKCFFFIFLYPVSLILGNFPLLSTSLLELEYELGTWPQGEKYSNYACSPVRRNSNPCISHLVGLVYFKFASIFKSCLFLMQLGEKEVKARRS